MPPSPKAPKQNAQAVFIFQQPKFFRAGLFSFFSSLKTCVLVSFIFENAQIFLCNPQMILKAPYFCQFGHFQNRSGVSRFKFGVFKIDRGFRGSNLAFSKSIGTYTKKWGHFQNHLGVSEVAFGHFQNRSEGLEPFVWAFLKSIGGIGTLRLGIFKTDRRFSPLAKNRFQNRSAPFGLRRKASSKLML